MWVARYRPAGLGEFVGNKEAVTAAAAFLKKWKKGRALLIYGPTGVGKSLLVRLLSAEREVVSMTPSDLRNRESVDAVLKTAAQQTSLFGKQKLLLVEDVDALSARDRGGIGALVDLIKESVVPVILTARNVTRRVDLSKWVSRFNGGNKFAIWKFLKEVAAAEGAVINDRVIWAITYKHFAEVEKNSRKIAEALNDLPVSGWWSWNQKLAPLRPVVQLVEMQPIPSELIEKRMRVIAKREKVTVTDEVLAQIAGKSGGDLRAATNILQVVATGADMSVIGGRDGESGIEEALKVIFKTKKARIAREAASGIEPKELIWWLDENIPRAFTDLNEIAEAYDWLSRADIFGGRVWSRGDRELASYQLDLAAIGARGEVGEVKIVSPLSRFSATNRSIRERTQAIGEKLAPLLHVGAKRITNYLPVLRGLSAEELSALGLEKEEIEFVHKDKDGTTGSKTPKRR